MATNPLSVNLNGWQSKATDWGAGDYTSMFSNAIPGVTNARLIGENYAGDPNNNGAGQYELETGVGNGGRTSQRQTVTVNPDGTISGYNPSAWGSFDGGSDLSNIAGAAGLFAGGFGAAGLLGAGPLAGMFGAGASSSPAAGNGAFLGDSADAVGMGGSQFQPFAQLPGAGTQYGGMLAQAGGGTPYTGVGAELPSGMDLAGDAGTYGANGIGTAGAAASGAAGVGGLSGLVSNGASKVGGSLVSNLIGSIFGGGQQQSGQPGTTNSGLTGIDNLGSLFTNASQYNNYNNLMGQIKDIYSPTGTYAQYLEGQLGRRDAAAGRNSQYGPRLTELTGRLADSQSKALQNLNDYMKGSQGGLNGMVGAGSRLLNNSGLGSVLSSLFNPSTTNTTQGGLSSQWALGPNAGPQITAPTDPNSNWSLPTPAQQTDPSYWNDLWSNP